MNESAGFAILAPMKTKGHRIRYLRAILGLTQTEFANRLIGDDGKPVSRGAVGNWERDKGIKADNLEQIAREFAVSHEWLSMGRGAAPVAKQNRAEPKRVSLAEWDPEAPDQSEPEPEFDAVTTKRRYRANLNGASPEIDVTPGAGEGAIGEEHVVAISSKGTVTGHRVVAEWVFPPSYLRNELKAAPSGALVLEVKGDSMNPTLQPGDRVIVDFRQNVFGPNGIYIIDDGDTEPRVKRLTKITASKPPAVVIVSDNPMDRERETLELSRLRIIGRVVGRVSRL